MSRRARSDAAFHVYMALGPQRSITRVREVMAADPAAYGYARPPSIRALEDYSVRDNWVARAAAIEGRAREDEERELTEQVKQHRARLRQEGLLLQQRGVAWLTAKGADEVRAGDAIRAIAEGFRLEALALGEPTERLSVEERLKQPLEGLSDDELTRLVDRLRRDPGSGADGAVEA